jgi:hypothetical protein
MPSKQKDLRLGGLFIISVIKLINNPHLFINVFLSCRSRIMCGINSEWYPDLDSRLPTAPLQAEPRRRRGVARE